MDYFIAVAQLRVRCEIMITGSPMALPAERGKEIWAKRRRGEVME